MPRLTERQAAFCRELVKGKSATQAARDAGYSDSYANRQALKLVDKPQVRKYLEELRGKIEDASIASATEVLQRLTSIARGEGRVERSTPAGIVELPPDWSDRQRALTDLAKYHALLVGRTEITLKRDPREMTDEELEEALRDANLT